MIKILNLHVPMPVVLLGIVDAVVLYLAIAGGLAFSYAPDTVVLSFFADGYAQPKLIFIFFSLITFFVIGAYSRSFLTNMKLGLLALVIAHVIILSVLSMAFYVFPSVQIWLSALLPALMLSFVGVFLTHLIFDRVVGIRIFKRNLLVLGAGPSARKVAHAAMRSPYLICVGFLPMEGAKVAIPETEILSDARPLVDLAKHYKVDEIVVAVEERRNRLATEPLLHCRLNGINVSEMSSFIEREEGHVEVDGLYPSWMIFCDGFNFAKSVQRGVKRIFDIAISLILCVPAFPSVALAALAIRLSSRGPIFYGQSRVGMNGEEFRIWKLRSMTVDAEGDGVPRWASPRDDRTTAVGRVLRRTRLDELPQLWNVLRGDMSFIGPRPERPEFVQQLTAQIPYYKYRHTVKPGISGWAQINYPYGASVQDAMEKLKYDLYYVKNYSLALDFIVLLQTFRVIIWPVAGTRHPVYAKDDVDPASVSGAGTSLSD